MEKKNKEIRKCVLCGAPIMSIYDSNNAYPLAEGHCCSKCNKEKVIPARIAAKRMRK